MSKKRRVNREQEARNNRKRYASWKDVLKESQWLQCARCGCKQGVKGDPLKKKCKRCGEPLATAR
jgi:hypothetical protein